MHSQSQLQAQIAALRQEVQVLERETKSIETQKEMDKGLYLDFLHIQESVHGAYNQELKDQGIDFNPKLHGRTLEARLSQIHAQDRTEVTRRQEAGVRAVIAIEELEKRNTVLMQKKADLETAMFQLQELEKAAAARKKALFAAVRSAQEFAELKPTPAEITTLCDDEKGQPLLRQIIENGSLELLKTAYDIHRGVRMLVTLPQNHTVGPEYFAVRYNKYDHFEWIVAQERRQKIGSYDLFCAIACKGGPGLKYLLLLLGEDIFINIRENRDLILSLSQMIKANLPGIIEAIVEHNIVIYDFITTEGRMLVDLARHHCQAAHKKLQEQQNTVAADIKQIAEVVTALKNDKATPELVMRCRTSDFLKEKLYQYIDNQNDEQTLQAAIGGSTQLNTVLQEAYPFRIALRTKLERVILNKEFSAKMTLIRESKDPVQALHQHKKEIGSFPAWLSEENKQQSAAVLTEVQARAFTIIFTAEKKDIPRLKPHTEAFSHFVLCVKQASFIDQLKYIRVIGLPCFELFSPDDQQELLGLLKNIPLLADALYISKRPKLLNKSDIPTNANFFEPDDVFKARQAAMQQQYVASREAQPQYIEGLKAIVQVCVLGIKHHRDRQQEFVGLQVQCEQIIHMIFKALSDGEIHQIKLKQLNKAVWHAVTIGQSAELRRLMRNPDFILENTHPDHLDRDGTIIHHAVEHGQWVCLKTMIDFILHPEADEEKQGKIFIKQLPKDSLQRELISKRTELDQKGIRNTPAEIAFGKMMVVKNKQMHLSHNHIDCFHLLLSGANVFSADDCARVMRRLLDPGLKVLLIEFLRRQMLNTTVNAHEIHIKFPGYKTKDQEVPPLDHVIDSTRDKAVWNDILAVAPHIATPIKCELAVLDNKYDLPDIVPEIDLYRFNHNGDSLFHIAMANNCFAALKKLNELARRHSRCPIYYLTQPKQATAESKEKTPTAIDLLFKNLLQNKGRECLAVLFEAVDLRSRPTIEFLGNYIRENMPIGSENLKQLVRHGVISLSAHIHIQVDSIIELRLYFAGTRLEILRIQYNETMRDQLPGVDVIIAKQRADNQHLDALERAISKDDVDEFKQLFRFGEVSDCGLMFTNRQPVLYRLLNPLSIKCLTYLCETVKDHKEDLRALVNPFRLYIGLFAGLDSAPLFFVPLYRIMQNDCILAMKHLMHKISQANGIMDSQVQKIFQGLNKAGLIHCELDFPRLQFKFKDCEEIYIYPVQDPSNNTYQCIAETFGLKDEIQTYKTYCISLENPEFFKALAQEPFEPKNAKKMKFLQFFASAHPTAVKARENLIQFLNQHRSKYMTIVGANYDGCVKTVRFVLQPDKTRLEAFEKFNAQVKEEHDFAQQQKDYLRILAELQKTTYDPKDAKQQDLLKSYIKNTVLVRSLKHAILKTLDGKARIDAIKNALQSKTALVVVCSNSQDYLELKSALDTHENRCRSELTKGSKLTQHKYLLRQVLTGHYAPDSKSFGADFLDYFSGDSAAAYNARNILYLELRDANPDWIVKEMSTHCSFAVIMQTLAAIYVSDTTKIESSDLSKQPTPILQVVTAKIQEVENYKKDLDNCKEICRGLFAAECKAPGPAVLARYKNNPELLQRIKKAIFQQKDGDKLRVLNHVTSGEQHPLGIIFAGQKAMLSEFRKARDAFAAEQKQRDESAAEAKRFASVIRAIDLSSPDPAALAVFECSIKVEDLDRIAKIVEGFRLTLFNLAVQKNSAEYLRILVKIAIRCNAKTQFESFQLNGMTPIEETLKLGHTQCFAVFLQEPSCETYCRAAFLAVLEEQMLETMTDRFKNMLLDNTIFTCVLEENDIVRVTFKGSKIVLWSPTKGSEIHRFLKERSPDILNSAAEKERKAQEEFEGIIKKLDIAEVYKYIIGDYYTPDKMERFKRIPNFKTSLFSYLQRLSIDDIYLSLPEDTTNRNAAIRRLQSIYAEVETKPELIELLPKAVEKHRVKLVMEKALKDKITTTFQMIFNGFYSENHLKVLEELAQGNKQFLQDLEAEFNKQFGITITPAAVEEAEEFPLSPSTVARYTQTSSDDAKLVPVRSFHFKPAPVVVWQPAPFLAKCTEFKVEPEDVLRRFGILFCNDMWTEKSMNLLANIDRAKRRKNEMTQDPSLTEAQQRAIDLSSTREVARRLRAEQRTSVISVPLAEQNGVGGVPAAAVPTAAPQPQVSVAEDDKDELDAGLFDTPGRRK